MSYSLPSLSYDYDALEPAIDARTMEIHHTKHHQGYVDKLNAALEDHADLQERPVEELLHSIDQVPDDIREIVINNGGGHANHSLFWTVMAPGAGGEPQGYLADALTERFGGFKQFREAFSSSAAGRFGSGWAWLVVDDGDVLSIMDTTNQHSPLMEGKMPILGLDVWEHAYYLQYQNRRGEYIDAWWDVVHWDEVERRFEELR